MALRKPSWKDGPLHDVGVLESCYMCCKIPFGGGSGFSNGSLQRFPCLLVAVLRVCFALRRVACVCVFSVLHVQLLVLSKDVTCEMFTRFFQYNFQESIHLSVKSLHNFRCHVHSYPVMSSYHVGHEATK